MARTGLLPALLACAFAWSAASQQAASSPTAAAWSARVNALINANDEHARLYDLGANVMGAALNGGQLCAPDWPLVRQRQAELARALAGVTPETGPLVLMLAVTANSLSDTRRLLEAGASREDPWGTLLHYAATFADPPMLEYLVAQGFGLEEVGGATAPALFSAVQVNRMDNVEWLVEHGADVNSTTSGTGQLLMYSLMCHDQKLVDYLLAAGAKPNAKTREVAARLGLSVGD
jgi:Ankyrin repeats (3 copies)